MESVEEAAFLKAIRELPADDLRRLVYADWLEEQGGDESRVKAEYLRLDVLLGGLSDDHPERDEQVLALRELAVQLPLAWKAGVAKVPIENCGVLWRFQCPKKWDRLEPTRSPEVRYCTACRRDVFLCDTVEKARRLAETLGHCVALDLGVRRTRGDMALLRSPPELGVDIEMGDVALPEDFNPGARPELYGLQGERRGFLHRLWRKLTGQ